MTGGIREDFCPLSSPAFLTSQVPYCQGSVDPPKLHHPQHLHFLQDHLQLLPLFPLHPAVMPSFSSHVPF